MRDAEKQRIQSLMMTEVPLDPYTNRSIENIGNVPLCRVDKNSMIVVCEGMHKGYLTSILKVATALTVAILTVLGLAIVINIEFTGSGFPIFAPLLFPPFSIAIGIVLAKLYKRRK